MVIGYRDAVKDLSRISVSHFLECGTVKIWMKQSWMLQIQMKGLKGVVLALVGRSIHLLKEETLRFSIPLML